MYQRVPMTCSSLCFNMYELVPVDCKIAWLNLSWFGWGSVDSECVEEGCLFLFVLFVVP